MSRITKKQLQDEISTLRDRIKELESIKEPLITVTSIDRRKIELIEENKVTHEKNKELVEINETQRARNQSLSIRNVELVSENKELKEKTKDFNKLFNDNIRLSDKNISLTSKNNKLESEIILFRNLLNTDVLVQDNDSDVSGNVTFWYDKYKEVLEHNTFYKEQLESVINTRDTYKDEIDRLKSENNILKLDCNKENTIFKTILECIIDLEKEVKILNSNKIKVTKESDGVYTLSNIGNAIDNYDKGLLNTLNESINAKKISDLPEYKFNSCDALKPINTDDKQKPDNKLIDKIVKQAEEISRLKNQNDINKVEIDHTHNIITNIRCDNDFKNKIIIDLDKEIYKLKNRNLFERIFNLDIESKRD